MVMFVVKSASCADHFEPPARPYNTDSLTLSIFLKRTWAAAQRQKTAQGIRPGLIKNDLRHGTGRKRWTGPDFLPPLSGLKSV